MEEKTHKRKWLDGLVPGDPVLVDERKKFVARLTPTQIIVEGGLRFRKSDGDAVGHDHYYGPQLEEVTAERVADIQQKADRRQALYDVDCIKWRTVPTSILKTVIELVKGQEKPKNDDS